MAQPHARINLVSIGLFAAIVVGVTIIALVAARSNTLPNNDEIYHLLAAESFLESGDYRVGDGIYERAKLFTRYVANFFDVFGASLETAKLSIALIYGLFVAAVFVSLRLRLGAGAAALCAFLLCISPLGLEFSTTVRFYVPQACFFWLASMLVYRSVVEKRWIAASLPLALVFFALAFILQPVTAVGLLAVFGWATLYLLVENRSTLLASRWVKSPVLMLSSGFALAAIAFALFQSGIIDAAFERYRSAALWNQGSRVQYYYWVMTEDFNPFWAAYPLAVLLALRRSIALTTFAAIVFAVSFVLLSFAGMKEDRYLLFALPFFFVPIAIAIVETYRIASSALRNFMTELLGRPSNLAMSGASLAVGFALMFFVGSNLGYVTAIKDTVAGETKREQPRWDLMVERYADSIADDTIVVTNSPNHGIYFLARPVIGMGASRLLDGSESAAEFSKDRRTGAVLVSSVDSLQKILDCGVHVLVIAENRQWRKNKNTGFPTAAADFIEQNMTEEDVPSAWKLRLYSAVRDEQSVPTDDGDAESAVCAEIGAGAS